MRPSLLLIALVAVTKKPSCPAWHSPWLAIAGAQPWELSLAVQYGNGSPQKAGSAHSAPMSVRDPSGSSGKEGSPASMQGEPYLSWYWSSSAFQKSGSAWMFPVPGQPPCTSLWLAVDAPPMFVGRLSQTMQLVRLESVTGASPPKPIVSLPKIVQWSSEMHADTRSEEHTS